MARGDGINRTTARNAKMTASKAINAQGHNEREKESYVNQDIVPERRDMNVHFKAPTDSYTAMFDQMVADGIISTRGLKADADKFGELIFDVNSAYFYNNGGYDFAKQFYNEAYKSAIEIVGGDQYILSAVMHADERNRAMSEALGHDVYHYHLHVVYVPIVEKEIRWSKRCKDESLRGTVKQRIMQVSMSKKWESQPELDDDGKPLLTKSGKPVLKKSYSLLQDAYFNHMRAAGYTDIERGELRSSEKHLTVTQFKVEKEQERLAILQEQNAQMEVEAAQLTKEKEDAERKAQQAQARLDDVAPKLKNMERLAAEFSSNPDELLPDPSTLESGKSYRENKAKPLIKRIVKVLRSVYHAYMDLKSQLERLQDAYSREISKNNSLSSQIIEVCKERDGLLEQVRDFNRVKKAYGPEQIAATIQAIKDQEQAQKAKQRHNYRDFR